ncbi:cytochrome P450 [Russula brevipes]|nr:cytochrome P450 [Russula brevipes]
MAPPHLIRHHCISSPASQEAACTSFPSWSQGLPIIGNALDIPSKNPWLTYCQWGKKYNSEIVHANSLGLHVIVLNSAKAVHELFEKRSSIYSDRYGICSRSYGAMLTSHVPDPTPFPDPTVSAIDCLSAQRLNGHGSKQNTYELEYRISSVWFRWRSWRKIFHEHFHPTASLQYRPRELKAARQLLGNLLRTPEQYGHHLRFMSGQVIMGIAYGIDIAPHDDPYVSLAEKALEAVEAASITGWTFDMLPFYMSLPWWFPGASFKKEAEKLAPHIDEMVNKPYQTVKDALAMGVAVPSVAASMIASLHEQPSREDELTSKAVPATMYIGKSFRLLTHCVSTVAALLTFFLAMVLHPEAQKRAQMEIDSVVGTGRLPDFDDEAALPFVSALVSEVMRWHPVAPIAVPHRLVVDDVYEGYFLPAGSIVIGNTWAVLHDESVYPEPSQFKPERYLDPNLKPPDAVFGRFMARSSMWIAIASVLTAYDISPVEEYTMGVISYPEAFKCTIRPRSKRAEELIASLKDVA